MILLRKKTALLITSILLITKAFCTGAGVQGSIKPSLFISDEKIEATDLSGTLTGTIRMSHFPIVVGAGLEAGNNGYGLSAFADFWALDIQIKNTWNFYGGLGAGGGVLTSDFKKLLAYIEPRFFIGMNWLFYDHYIEVYTQQNITPSFKSDKTFSLELPFEAGVRLHF